MIFALLLLAALFLAWSNGANDNFKGVATLYGSATAGFRKSLYWASLTTALGSLVSVSTTHVSCGTIFGIGMVSRGARWRTIGRILLTWVTTLPLGLLLGVGIYLLLNV